MARRIISASLYVNSVRQGTATSSSMEHTSNTQVVKTDAGNVIQIGREDGQFTMEFVIPFGDTGYTTLRNAMKVQSEVEIQFRTVGDSAHVARCVISTLGAQTNHADGSLTANVTFIQVSEAEVVGFL